MASQNQVAATFGAGIFLALGLVGLMSTTFVNQATTLGLDQFLQLWAEAILAIVFAFVLLIAAILIGSRVETRSIIGGALGTLASILGAINSLFLLSLTYGIVNPVESPYLATDFQLSLSVELLLLMTLVVLVAGMPLVLVGSFRQLNEKSE